MNSNKNYKVCRVSTDLIFKLKTAFKEHHAQAVTVGENVPSIIKAVSKNKSPKAMSEASYLVKFFENSSERPAIRERLQSLESLGTKGISVPRAFAEWVKITFEKWISTELLKLHGVNNEAYQSQLRECLRLTFSDKLENMVFELGGEYVFKVGNQEKITENEW